MRSSDKIYDWLINNERFGKTIEDYNTGKGIKKSTKIRAISLMWITITASVYFFITNILVIGLMYTIAILVSIYILKQPTIE